MDERMAMNERGRRLAEALIEPTDEAACVACLNALEPYVDTQLAGGDYQMIWPAVARHLDSCVLCAESYARIYEIRLLGDTLPVPPAIPEPDLGFLQRTSPAPLIEQQSTLGDVATRLGEALASAVERSGERLRLRLSSALLELLPPPLATAPAMRSATSEGTLLVDLTLPEPSAAVERFRFSVHARQGAPDRSIVRVEIALRGREWPDLADVPITLDVDGDRHEHSTDAWGEAIFEDVPTAAVPRLQIEVDTEAVPPTST
jgi:hypothetical protein